MAAIATAVRTNMMISRFSYKNHMIHTSLKIIIAIDSGKMSALCFGVSSLVQAI